MNSVYSIMNMINDTESLSEKYNVTTRKDSRKLKESHENFITQDQLKSILTSWKDNNEFGFLTLSENAVRFTSEELDFQQYAKISDLVTAVNADKNLTIEKIKEDPRILTRYFEDSCGIHHYFEIPDFIEMSTKLNLKYFGVAMVDEVDTDLHTLLDDFYNDYDESEL